MNRVAKLLAACGMIASLSACDPKVQAKPVEPSTPTTPTPQVQKAPDVPDVMADPFLYKIDGPNGPVYLMGTIHVAVDPRKDVSPIVWKTFESSSSFVMEADASKAQSILATKMFQPKGQTLQKQMGEPAWAKLNEIMRGQAAMYNGMKSWVVVTLLLMKMLPDNVDKTVTMDGQMLAQARKSGKDVEFLETPEFQVSVLEKTLTHVELSEMVMEFDENKKELGDMIVSYKKGDAKAIETMSFKDLESRKENYDLLFFKRNESWIAPIQSYVKKGNVFVAFGAGHLFGDRGVLNLLKKQGIEAKRVSHSE